MRNYNCNTVKLLLVILSLSWQPKSVRSLCSTPDQGSFLSYFPCTHVENLTSVEECDIFAYTAARLAVKRLEETLSVSNIPRSLPETLVAIPTGKDGELDIEEVIFRSAEHLVDHETFGIVGPSHPELANRIAPIASDRLGILQVSYSPTDVEVDSPNSTFYRDLPSDLFVNEAGLSLLNEFQWHKVGMLTSEEISFAKVAARLIETYSRDHNVEIVFSGTFQAPESSEPALKEMAGQRLRIIIGLFAPSDARRVLCRARGYGLTTSEHVWILPSYYNPNWWKLDDTELEGLPDAERCSNDDMIDILNSALFADPVKYPLLQPDNMEFSGFHDQLIAETKELFPSLSDIDLTPFLLHSRASGAYEAVWLMALAWMDVLTNNRSCDGVHVEELQNSIEKMIFCEWCNIYSDCLTNEPLMEDCASCVDHTVTFAESDRIMEYYGQILVSQFINGIHCPIGFYWPASLENNINNGKLEFVKFADLESSSHCLHKLQLDASILNYTSGCPSDFWWKGRSSPPSGVYPLTYSDIGTTSLVITCVLIAFGLVYAIALLVASIVWRNNKHIKASSPRLNIVIIVMFIFTLPSPLLSALVISSNRLPSSSSADVLCQVLQWLIVFPESILFVTLLVKNWRIYRIFHNKLLKEDLSWWLSDKALLVFIILMAVPFFIVLIIWSVIDPLQLTNLAIDDTAIDDDINDDTDIVTICDCNDLEIWIGIIALYAIVITLALLFIAYQNTKVHSRFSETEGKAGQKSLLFLLVIAVPRILVAYFFLEQPSWYLFTFWMTGVFDTIYEGLLVAIVLLPPFVRMYKDHVRSTKDSVRKKESERYQKDYEAAREEIQKLKTQLNEMEKKKQMLTSSQILA